MPPNNSSTGGYLSPLPGSLSPLQDAALDTLIHDVLQALTGINGSLVRPRWQPEPPNQPDINTDWIAFGVIEFAPETYGHVTHSGIGNGGSGQDNIQRHEELSVLCSHYGPNAGAFSSLVRDALITVAQNRAALHAANTDVVEIKTPIAVPV